jgi:hypothetical protein
MRRRLPEGVYLDARSGRYKVTVKIPGQARQYIGTAGSLEEAAQQQAQHLSADGETRVILRQESVDIPNVQFVFGVAFPPDWAPTIEEMEHAYDKA